VIIVLGLSYLLLELFGA